MTLLLLALVVQQDSPDAAGDAAPAAEAIADDSPLARSLDRVIDTPDVDAPDREQWLAEVPPRPEPGVVRGSLTFEQGAAYYRLLDHASRVDSAALCRVARSNSAAAPPSGLFADLLRRPGQWQGKPVALSGHLNRLLAVPAGPNDYGIDTLYEGWLVSTDSQRYPTVLICHSIDERMPLGESVINGVSACGYVFKLHAYAARDSKGRLAPMVMVGRLNYSPPAPLDPPLSGTTKAIAIGVFAALVVAVLVSLSRRPSSQRRRHPQPEDGGFDFVDSEQDGEQDSEQNSASSERAPRPDG